MTAIRLIILVLLIIGLVWLVRWDADNPEVSIIKSFVAAQIPSACALFLLAYRTKHLSNSLIDLGTALRGNALAVAGTLFLPARLGDLGKPFYFRILSGFPASKGLVLVIEERIWDFVGLAILAILTLLLVGDQPNAAKLQTASKVVFAIAILGVLILIVVPRAARRLPGLASLEQKYALFSSRTLTQLVAALSISLLIWGASLTILVVAYQLSGLPDLRLEQLMFLFIASTLGLLVSVTPGSVGTYEGAIIAVLVGYDVDWKSALAFAISFRLTWLALPLFFAIVALMSDTNLITLLRKSNSS